jgi:hypothetical protein
MPNICTDGEPLPTANSPGIPSLGNANDQRVLFGLFDAVCAAITQLSSACQGAPPLIPPKLRIQRDKNMNKYI